MPDSSVPSPDATFRPEHTVVSETADRTCRTNALHITSETKDDSAMHLSSSSSRDSSKEHSPTIEVPSVRTDTLDGASALRVAANRRFALCAVRPNFSSFPCRFADAHPPISTQSIPPTKHAGCATVAATAAASFEWSVLWDIENICVPATHSISQVVHAIIDTLNALHPHRTADAPPAQVRRIVTFSNTMLLNTVERAELYAAGVELIHVDSEGRKDASDKAFITELVLTALEHRPPHGICLISHDADYAYPLSVVMRRGYTTAVIFNKKSKISNLLFDVPDYVFKLKGAVLHDHSRVKRRKRNQGWTHENKPPKEERLVLVAPDNDECVLTASSLLSRRLQLLYKSLFVSKKWLIAKATIVSCIFCATSHVLARRALAVGCMLAESEMPALGSTMSEQSVLLYVIDLALILACVFNLMYILNWTSRQRSVESA